MGVGNFMMVSVEHKYLNTLMVALYLASTDRMADKCLLQANPHYVCDGRNWKITAVPILLSRSEIIVPEKLHSSSACYTDPNRTNMGPT